MSPQIQGRQVLHKHVKVAGADIFYREAGHVDAPIVLLPHGYPCSSYEFRNLMPELADHWRLLAPDFPGSGYSEDTASFAHDFDGYSIFLELFADAVGASRFVLYLHDFGGWIGLRLAMRRPERIAALIIQNSDIYEDALGPKYASLKEYWNDPTPDRREKLASAISLEGFREEFLNEVKPELADRIAPDLWHLHWSLTTPLRRKIAANVIASTRENVAWFPRYQEYLRRHKPPALIVWGPQDGYMPEESAKAYLRDLPDAELHLLDGGHWLLETSLQEVAARIRNFLTRVHA